MCDNYSSSWGLNLFVLFEPTPLHVIYPTVLEDWIYLYYLNSLFCCSSWYFVLEDWIYLYYLNATRIGRVIAQFLRIEFICIIWTYKDKNIFPNSSWGLNLFVLFEPLLIFSSYSSRSWGLNLFVLFERWYAFLYGTWVLEDWIYLYYLNL